MRKQKGSLVSQGRVTGDDAADEITKLQKTIYGAREYVKLT